MFLSFIFIRNFEITNNNFGLGVALGLGFLFQYNMFNVLYMARLAEIRFPNSPSLSSSRAAEFKWPTETIPFLSKTLIHFAMAWLLLTFIVDPSSRQGKKARQEKSRSKF